MAEKKGAHVMTPTGKDAVSVRKVSMTKEEREKSFRDFRERKNEEEKIKEERFAEIRGRRKERKDSPGGGINIDITSDN